jgi:flagellar basal body rod protein FlgG
MIRALYTAASGLETGLRLQDVVAENLANSSTTGYKGDRAAAREFAGVLAHSIGNAPVPVPMMLSRALGRIGTGSFVQTQRLSLADGAPRTTGAPLDVMIQGNGLFAVQGADGAKQYTRDGHFGRDPQNQLVTADGALVLGQDGRPITLESDHVRIDGTGQVFKTQTVPGVNGAAPTITEQLISMLQVITVDPGALVRAGKSQFTLIPNAVAAPAVLGSGGTHLTQGSLEESNVDATALSTELMSLGRNFGASQHVFTTINETLDASVNRVGKLGG